MCNFFTYDNTATTNGAYAPTGLMQLPIKPDLPSLSPLTPTDANNTMSDTMPSLPVVVVSGPSNNGLTTKMVCFSPLPRADFDGEISGDSGTKPSVPESPLLVYNINVCYHTFFQWKWAWNSSLCPF